MTSKKRPSLIVGSPAFPAKADRGRRAGGTNANGEPRYAACVRQRLLFFFVGRRRNVCQARERASERTNERTKPTFAGQKKGVEWRGRERAPDFYASLVAIAIRS